MQNDEEQCNGRCASEVVIAENIQCTAKDRLKKALFTYFKHSEFRPGQLESTLPAIHGRDVFVRMATGSGKSLCMFLVPLALNNVAMGIIISPLNALMNQQVRQHTDSRTVFSDLIRSRSSSSAMLGSRQLT